MLFALIISHISRFPLSSLAGNISLQQHIPSLSSPLSCSHTHQEVVSPLLYNLFYDPWWTKFGDFWFTFLLDSLVSLYNMSSASLPTIILNDMKPGKEADNVFFFLYRENQEITREPRSTQHEKQRIAAEFPLAKQLPGGSQEPNAHSR